MLITLCDSGIDAPGVDRHTYGGLFRMLTIDLDRPVELREFAGSGSQHVTNLESNSRPRWVDLEGVTGVGQGSQREGGQDEQTTFHQPHRSRLEMRAKLQLVTPPLPPSLGSPRLERAGFGILLQENYAPGKNYRA